MSWRAFWFVASLLIQPVLWMAALVPGADANPLVLQSGQVYDGGGQTIYADDCGSYTCAAIWAKDVRDVVIRNVTIVGTNATGADGVHKPGGSWEWQHGIYVSNSHNVRIEHVRAYRLWGDAVALQEGSSNVTIDGLTSRQTGRNGVSFVNVNDSRLVNSDIADVGFGWLVDMEPDFGSDSVRNITVAYNRFGHSRMANVNLSGPYGGASRYGEPDGDDGHPWSNITVAFNEFTAGNDFGQPHVWLEPLSGFYGTEASVHDNCGARVQANRFVGARLWGNTRGQCTRHWRAKIEALAYAEAHPGFDAVGVRCGPRFCRWYLDDVDAGPRGRGLTCTARAGDPGRCHRRYPRPRKRHMGIITGQDGAVGDHFHATPASAGRTIKP